MLGGITRYTCPLPDCGWTRDVQSGDPAASLMAVELAMREHADDHSPLEYLRALLVAQDARHAATEAERPLAVGQVLHGFCGGHFGRDHYNCSHIEALGPDWIVVRDTEGVLDFAAGTGGLLKLRQYRAQSEYCPGNPCPVQPAQEA